MPLYKIQTTVVVQRKISAIRGISVKRSFSGVSDLPWKIRLSYLIIPKITIGIVIIRSLFIVVALETSAKKSQTGSDAFGDSKKVYKDQLIQAALPNIVTYELNNSLG